MKLKLFLILVLILINLTPSTLGAVFSNVVSACAAEDNAASNSYAGACDVASGASLQFDDASLETHTYRKNTFGGVRIQSVNTGITGCTSVSKVELCYKWWRTNTATPQNCKVGVDANGGVSYSSVTTTCPAIAEPAGMTCTDVTALESWTCGSFFGPTGTRALARSELSRVGTGATTTETGTWDVLFFNVTYTTNTAPTINNLTSSHTTIKGGNTITFSASTPANGVNDTEANTLTLYCDTTTTPTAANTDCTGGTTVDTTYPYSLSCTFATPTDSTTHTEYCRVYDGSSYSPIVNQTYTTDSTAPTTSVISVAGDTTPSYFDTINDGVTEILVSGESGMACRWSSTDTTYSGMSNACSITGAQANCSVNNVASQGLNTRYISCQDSLTNEQTSSNNLDVQFYLDYTAPTTSDNSDTSFHVPTYSVTITESDNVDSDPTSYYCTSSSIGCIPTTPIDNGGIISYTTSNRGLNYLRYYSVDDAGNTQTIVNKTIKINRLPTFTSAVDDAVIIKGGSTVNITTVSADADSQVISLFVCDSNSATSSGCTSNEYCSSSGNNNLSCTFTSETDSTSHNWYAFLFDSLNEIATTNFTGTYTTDSTSPTLTINSPINGTTYNQNSITLTVTGNENLNWAGYSINGGSNITLSNISGTQWSGVNSSIADGNYNITFYGNDTYGNMGSSGIAYFTINTTPADTTPPTITIHSPINGTYYTVAPILLNITSDENLSWAGYRLDSNSILNLTSTTPKNWNKTITLTEGQHNITFYANDTANNQGRSNITIYTDLTNPTISFECDSPVTTSQNVTCTANFTDAIGLDYAIFSNNATGIWENSSQLFLSGTSDNLTQTIRYNNTSPPQFSSRIYLFDLSGRTNTTSTTIVVTDDIAPIISNITYFPNTTAALDPGVQVNITADVVENYNISTAYLMYKNSSVSNWSFVLMSNTSATNYNGNFTPQNGTWQFKINATDSSGNENISATTEIVVEDEISANISTTIPSIKSYILTQAGDNKTLGEISLNNTGDSTLNFSINATSSNIQARLDINSTNNQTDKYIVASGNIATATMYVNTTGLPVGVYNYTITITSGAGTTTLDRQLNIQNVAGALLSVSIDTYSSTVTKGQTGLQLVSSVTNLGTSEARNVSLNWTLPSAFSITSGSADRDLGAIPIGASGTNTITITVDSNAADSIVNIIASAGALGNLSDNVSKSVTIGSPSTVTSTIRGGGGGPAGGGSAGPAEIKYERIIEIVRGKEDSFTLDIGNPYSAVLEDLEITMMGFPQQYIDINPETIESIPPNWTSNFTATVEVPLYEIQNEYDLRAIITGWIKYSEDRRSTYKQTQYIKLIVQEVSKEDTEKLLQEAREAIQEMKNAEFNTFNVENLLEEAEGYLEERKNKQAYTLAGEIISLKNTAFNANNLINLLIDALKHPGKTNLLTGDVTKQFSTEYGSYNLQDILTGKAAFSSDSIQDLLALAVAAFERGDYLTAEERLNEARVLLLLERKGNIGLFFYLYWYYIIIGLLILTIIGLISYRRYQKSSITKRIDNINKEEENIKKLLIENQRNYYAAKISDTEFHSIESQHHNKLTKLKKLRSKLRNKRIKTLRPREALRDIDIENMEIEHTIKTLQTEFYKKGKITEKEYKLEFAMLNERLAELEGERTTLELMKGKVKREKKVEVNNNPKKIKRKNVKNK